MKALLPAIDAGMTEKPMGGTDIRKNLFRVATLLLALGLLFWLLNRIGWDKIGQAFGTVGYSGALIILAFGLAENICDALAAHFAVRGVGIFRLLCYNGAGAIVNIFIPLEAGEVVKGALFSRHVSAKQAISGAVLWNYVFKITRPVAALMAVAVAWIAGHGLPDYIAAIISVSCLAAFLPYLVMRLLLRIGVAGMTARFLSWLKIFRRDPERLVASAREIDARLRRFWKERPGDFIRVMGCQLLARIAAWGSWTAAIWLVGLDYSFGRCAIIFAGLSIINYLVLLSPAKLGVGEGGGFLLFKLMGLDGGMGLIIFLLIRLKSIITNGTAGLAVFMLPRPKPADKSDERAG